MTTPTKTKAGERMQHTPGPWESEDKSREDDPNSIRIACYKGYLAVTTGATPEDTANARLIAAAPELLKQLWICCDIMDRNEVEIPVDVFRALESATKGA
jgi:hypothetical protein